MLGSVVWLVSLMGAGAFLIATTMTVSGASHTNNVLAIIAGRIMLCANLLYFPAVLVGVIGAWVAYFAGNPHLANTLISLPFVPLGVFFFGLGLLFVFGD